MLSAKYEFENGQVRTARRGIILWNGSEDELGPDNPRRLFDDLIYDMVGAGFWTLGHELKGIRVSIEIDEAIER